MAKLFAPLPSLSGEQKTASAHDQLAFVSASAGTGKTQVLTARVIRLLLNGVDPSAILCLTFTKAGAAEMADRIHERLAHWVRLKDAVLAAELIALGEDHGPESVEKARRLFARVLDARGGGLRIQTIHAFAQSLLGAFPAEAGIVPGFHPLEGREEALLARETMAAMLVAAEERGDDELIGDIQTLSRRLGEKETENFVMRCARAPEAMDGLGDTALIGDQLRRALGVPLGDIDAAIEQWCDDETFDCAALREFAAANREWGTKTGLQRAEAVADWLASAPAVRREGLFDLRRAWMTLGGTFAKPGFDKLDAIHGEYQALIEALDEAVGALLAMRIKADFADFAAAGLRAGQQFARDYALAKRRAGGLDFDDLIRLTRALLLQPGMGDWVRYKLDQGIDHILVDEAQDTNDAQWLIVEKLAEEFWQADLENEPNSDFRTIFAVGDFKQAIFGFQGTSPHQFNLARTRFAGYIAERQRELHDLSLDRSYRSTLPILELVDQVMQEIGAEAIGYPGALRAHRSGREKLPGRVSLWRPVVAGEDDNEGEAEEGWLGDATLEMARRLAKQVRAWLDEPLWLEAKNRALRPEDVLILVRRRSELASLIVARLHQEGVPVAGVDRLMLTDPLAVQDLLSALRFALQPDDDLNLAALLVSPLFGWSQEELYDVAYRRGDTTLWRAVREGGGATAEAREGLSAILARADLETPYQLLESILSGSLDGRRKLLARLGAEARDPIEELLNTALLFERDNPPSLQHFLDWFERGEAEIKRDPSAPLDAVRVMTVHGAKGLEAPLVILADATFDPTLMRGGGIELAHAEGKPPVPVPRPRKAEQIDALADAVDRLDAEEREEHWRLLYVALTRAEEHLVIGGALGPRAKGEPPEESWYAAVGRALETICDDWEADPLWGGVRHFRGHDPVPPPTRKAPRPPRSLSEPEEPDWIRKAAPPEERPPRPLAPSALGPDDIGQSPPGETAQLAAKRGTLLHRLFERLPDVAPDRRREAASQWLAARGTDPDIDPDELIDTALAVIEAPQYAALFSRDALAEAPIAAVVDDVVVSGTVDRLLIGDETIRIVDFKTGREVPDSAERVPTGYLRQMAAYRYALEIIFPGRVVEAWLLYTAGPHMLRIPETLLADHKPHFADQEQSLSALG